MFECISQTAIALDRCTSILRLVLAGEMFVNRETRGVEQLEMELDMAAAELERQQQERPDT
ncbi:hypothetical protein F7734_58980 [Scytonema sp. UIC 10036]|uniref:hypothetical protein n=1 Tax=Scytonema sp. UIC 10036 TaxID=2304196 RepID=UPI0012DA168D|nr:hypothetical protein [Scytonema sp. UIC 10036]MUH01625.1 hypothetical protein [Scytonema sp. UIC 10036]